MPDHKILNLSRTLSNPRLHQNASKRCSVWNWDG